MRVNDADRERFAQTYQDHARAVFNVAAHLGGRDVAADVTQEVFLRYWRRPRRFDPDRGSLRAFLLVMTRGVTVDVLRATGAPRAHPPHSDVAGRVRDALQHLKQGEREAIVMAFYGGLTYREVAAALNAAEGTVKSQIRSGLRYLTNYIESNEIDALGI